MFLVAALYVAIGLALAVLSALRGDPLGTFLGFLIVSGALGATVVLNAVLRVSAQADSLGEQLQMISRHVVHLEEYLSSRLDANGPPGGTGAVRNLDLASIGAGDPSVLAAATLNRSVYPRLVRTMEEDPPADCDATPSLAAESTSDATNQAIPFQGLRTAEPAGEIGSNGDVLGGGAATKNLLALWRRAVRDGDLMTCQAVYSALVDTAGPNELAPLREQLHAIADGVERELREQFSRCIKQKNFAAALATGDAICRALFDRPVAEEFQRLRPMLAQRAQQNQGDAETRSAAR